ncbi:stage III sporulation protein AG [Bacillus niameyensis]|uniref:stage III sporulation protein AG n=1 Tax=Bacillus niameyensis TaxID=1522308 RepID=UPI000783835C|nr:stage III sporulation protein AG [Bacillus niameyensis]
MSNQNNPFDWIKEKIAAFKTSPSPDKKGGKSSYLLILLVLGAFLMILGSIWKEPPKDATVVSSTSDESSETFGTKNTDTNSEMKIFEEQYENQLKDALEQIVGVHSVSVIVNVEATERKVLEKNAVLRSQTTREEDQEGGVRQIEDQSKEDEVVIIQNGDKEEPIILETKKPEIKGVLVVAGGAENIQVEKWIIQAVTRVLDVPSHRVAVIPKKSKGDS